MVDKPKTIFEKWSESDFSYTPPEEETTEEKTDQKNDED
jgi:hypothetical protein